MYTQHTGNIEARHETRTNPKRHLPIFKLKEIS